MTLPDIIAVLVILIVIGAAVFYIIWSKKKGKHCIGCPDSSACNGNCQCCGADCTHHTSEKEGGDTVGSESGCRCCDDCEETNGSEKE